MKTYLRFLPPLLALAAYACSDDASDGSITDTDNPPAPTLPDATVLPSDSGSPKSIMRLAHLATGLDIEKVDFCWKSAGSGSFEGPVLGAGVVVGDDAGQDAGDDADLDAEVADAGDASVGATLAYREVSRYVTLDGSGPLTLAVVPAGRPCGASMIVADVTLDPGKLNTVMLAGSATSDAGDALGVTAFTDDRTTIPTSARVRVIHAALGPDAVPIAVRASSGITVDLAARVEPRHTGTASTTVDAFGYATIAPLPSPATIAVSPAEASDGGTPGWQSMPAPLDLRGESLHTAFVLTGEGAPYEVLWCTDTSTSGDNTTCVLLK